MKTLDYLHLNEKKVAGVTSALHQLLADFQVHYTNPVSYTHLKSEGRLHLSIIKQTGFYILSAPVSYTHLDVYKRQEYSYTNCVSHSYWVDDAFINNSNWNSGGGGSGDVWIGGGSSGGSGSSPEMCIRDRDRSTAAGLSCFPLSRVTGRCMHSVCPAY